MSTKNPQGTTDSKAEGKIIMPYQADHSHQGPYYNCYVMLTLWADQTTTVKTPEEPLL